MMLKKFKYNDIQQCHFSNMCDELNELCYKKDVESHKPNKIKSNYILILHDYLSNFIHRNNIKLYYAYKKNKYFINLEKNTSTQSFILEINSAERSFSTVKLKCHNSNSELVTVMLLKYVSALLAEEMDLHGYFLTVCIHRNFSSFICITPDMLKEYPNGYANAVRIIIEINGERIDEIHNLPFCRGMAIRRRRSLTTVI